MWDSIVLVSDNWLPFYSEKPAAEVAEHKGRVNPCSSYCPSFHWIFCAMLLSLLYKVGQLSHVCCLVCHCLIHIILSVGKVGSVTVH